MMGAILATLLLAPPAVGQRVDLGALQLTWRDEFDGKALDPTKWQAPEMPRQGNASEWKPEMVQVRDGHLILKARYHEGKEPRWTCGAVRTRPDYDASRTFFQQRYGYFEIRCTLPKDLRTDVWLAFWIMSGDIRDGQTDSRRGTEIDIMESFNAWDGRINHALHWGGYGDTHNGASVESARQRALSDGKMHTYGLWWDEKGYRFTFDGVVIAETSAVGLGDPKKALSQGASQEPGYLKVSLEAAKWAGPYWDWEPARAQSDEVKVDWVRVYQFRK